MSNAPKKPQEMNMEQRLLLALGLMGLVLLVSTYLIPQPKPAPAPKKDVTKQESTKQDAPKQEATRTTPKPKPAVAKKAAAVANVASAKEETFQIDTDLYHVEFSNRGAVVRHWVLKKYKDSQGQPLDLVNQNGTAKTGLAPFSIRFHVDQPADALNNALYVVRAGAGKLSVEFLYVAGPWSASKTFSFQNGSYLAEVSSEVRYSGAGKPHLLYWRGGFGDDSVIGAAASQQSVRFDLNDNKFQALAAGDLKEPQAHRGRFSFAGINDAYFAAVALPETGRDFEIHSMTDPVPDAVDKKEQPHTGVAVGGDAQNRFTLFVGPKDTSLLRSVSPKLEQLVDFGWWAFIGKPLFLSLNWLNEKHVHNFGWSIVLATIVINFLLLPLKITSLRSMRKMSVLQPHIQAINEKYRGLSMKDPRKQQQNAEVMDLYKKHGVNPAGGCVPMVLQIPFFIGFYSALTAAIEMRGAQWLWIRDLSQMDSTYVLPVILVGTQFVLQKMTPSTSADPSQQKVMMLMPLFLGWMFASARAGLVLYWFTGNVVGIAQQLMFNRFFPAPAGVPAPPVKKKESRK